MEISKQAMKDKACAILKEMGAAATVIDDYRNKNEVPVFWLGLGKVPKGKEVSFGASDSPKKATFDCSRLLELYEEPGEVFAITIDVVQGLDTINFLYVSPYYEDLEFMCMRTHEENVYRVYAYCYNVDKPEYSESGFVFVKQENGFLKRIA